jgi:hypothetical protein
MCVVGSARKRGTPQTPSPNVISNYTYSLNFSKNFSGTIYIHQASGQPPSPSVQKSGERTAPTAATDQSMNSLNDRGLGNGQKMEDAGAIYLADELGGWVRDGGVGRTHSNPQKG